MTYEEAKLAKKRFKLVEYRPFGKVEWPNYFKIEHLFSDKRMASLLDLRRKCIVNAPIQFLHPVSKRRFKKVRTEVLLRMIKKGIRGSKDELQYRYTLDNPRYKKNFDNKYIYKGRTLQK